MPSRPARHGTKCVYVQALRPGLGMSSEGWRQEWACPQRVGDEDWACPPGLAMRTGHVPSGLSRGDGALTTCGRRSAVPWQGRRAGGPHGVVLFGVVVRFEDLDQAVEGGVGAVALGTQHHNLAVRGAQAHQGQDAGRVHGLVLRFAEPGDGDFEIELASSLGKDGGRAGMQPNAAGNGGVTFGHFCSLNSALDYQLGKVCRGPAQTVTGTGSTVSTVLLTAQRLSAITDSAVTTVPTAIETTNIRKLSIAKKTKMPPCGALDPTPAAIEMAPVTAPPTMLAGMTRSGSAAAKGMAPSEMNDAPSSQAALPFSCSARLKSFLFSTVEARAMASGGTMPEAMTAAMICHGAWLSRDAAPRPATAKEYATLLTGPPRSKHIIRPRITPRAMAPAPVSPESQAFRPLVMATIGPPRIRNISPEATREASSGMMTTGIRPRSQRATCRRPITRAM